MLSLEEFKCLLNYLWCCAADGTTALAREYRGMHEAPPFAFDRVQAEKSMIVLFSVSSAPMPLPRSLRPRRRKTTGSPVPYDPGCCYLLWTVAEPAAENCPEKCGWGLHVVRANVVQGQVCSRIFCGLVRENTRVFKLSNNLAELVALVHAWDFVLSRPSSLNFMICFDFMFAAHVVQQSWQAKSHLEVVRFAGELHRRCDLHAEVRWHWVRGHSRGLGSEAADALAKAGAWEQWHLCKTAYHVIWKPCFVRVRATCCFWEMAAVSLLHASAVGSAITEPLVVYGLQLSPRFPATGAPSLYRRILDMSCTSLCGSPQRQLLFVFF